MTEQFSEITVGIAPEVETVTPHWVVAEEYGKLQARIEELETQLTNEKIRTDYLEFSRESWRTLSVSRVLGQCTPSRNRTTGFGARLGRQIDLILGL